jgi:hypothetical protein
MPKTNYSSRQTMLSERGRQQYKGLTGTLIKNNKNSLEL